MSGYYFESVIGSGQVEFIDNIPEKCKALTLLMKHQSNRDFDFTEKAGKQRLCIQGGINGLHREKKTQPKGR